jgi:hypothetical protein
MKILKKLILLLFSFKSNVLSFNVKPGSGSAFIVKTGSGSIFNEML